MTSDDKNRPSWQAEANRKNINSNHILQPDRVFGRVRLDLAKYYARDFRGNCEHEVTRRLQSLTGAPNGVQVVLAVAEGQSPPWAGVQYVRRECGHLGSIMVECEDSATSAAWLSALKWGQW